MKVLILGATGFVGLPVAQAFVRAGYEVFGQTRSANKVKSLEAEEIIPVVADPADASQWSDVVAKVDVVIDCIGGMEIRAIGPKVFQTVSEAAKKARGSATPKLTFIYSSGAWVHGSDLDNIKSERSTLGVSIPLVSWRPEHEQRVVSSTEFDGIVIRPTLVYGRSASIVSMIFGTAKPGEKFEWPGTPGGRWSTIHVDDLADAYVRIAAAAPICKGLIFDVSNDYTESVDDILAATVRVTKATGYSYRKPQHAFEEAITGSIMTRPSLARALVGWRPVKAGLVDGIKTYYAAWKASVE